VANYDPVPDIRRIAVPILVVLGESDPLGPADLAAREWRSALPENETRSQVIVVPGMGHAARSGATHSGNDPLNPDYIAAVETFVATVLRR
jgi:pimeloyl-ACP methyl ester carboxylesterase